MEIGITLILPIYNVEKYLRKCLDRVCVQTLSDKSQTIQIILVDDGSTDLSGKICDEYAGKDNRIEVIHKKNSGVASARNTGLDLAKGTFVAFLDSDDFIENEYCQKAYEEGMNSGADIVIFDGFWDTSTETLLWKHAPEPFCMDSREQIEKIEAAVLYPHFTPFKMKDVQEVPFAAPWDKIYRRSFLEENNLRFRKNLKVLDDMVFNFECFDKARKISYISHPLYHYIYHSDSITNSYKKDRAKKDQEVFKFLQTFLAQKRYMEEFQSTKQEINSKVIQKQNKESNNAESQYLDLAEVKGKPTLLERAYYCRVVKSFAILCRLYFFAAKCPLTKNEKYQRVIDVMENDTYKIAFNRVSWRDLEWKLKAVYVVFKLKSPRLLYLLNRLQEKSS